MAKAFLGSELDCTQKVNPLKCMNEVKKHCNSSVKHSPMCSQYFFLVFTSLCVW